MHFQYNNVWSCPVPDKKKVLGGSVRAKGAVLAGQYESIISTFSTSSTYSSWLYVFS